MSKLVLARWEPPSVAPAGPHEPSGRVSMWKAKGSLGILIKGHNHTYAFEKSLRGQNDHCTLEAESLIERL